MLAILHNLRHREDSIPVDFSLLRQLPSDAAVDVLQAVQQPSNVDLLGRSE